jgi:hypothetical protein
MSSVNCRASFLAAMARLGVWSIAAFLLPGAVCGQDTVVVVGHESTPEAELIRAKADAALLQKQAELVGEVAKAQTLQNLMKECDLKYQRMLTYKKTKGTPDSKFERKFDLIQFNQQLADIRGELETKTAMKRTRVGDPTNDMNAFLEKFARQPVKADRALAMTSELTAEQLDAIFLTNGSNIFSGKTGKTRLEAFKWPFFIQKEEFQQERSAFDAECSGAAKEINSKGAASPETITSLLKMVAAIESKLDAMPTSDNPNIRAVETKWRRESKTFLRDLTRTLGDTSKLDAERLAKYVFHGKTLGELVEHLNANGLRFSHPAEQDANLYASVFFVMRYAYQDAGKDAQAGGAQSAADGGDCPAAEKPAGEPTSRTRWGNTTNNHDTVISVGEGQWIMLRSNIMAVMGPFTEIGRNRDYVELRRSKARPKVPTYFRLYADHIEAKKGDDWECVANGHWLAAPAPVAKERPKGMPESGARWLFTPKNNATLISLGDGEWATVLSDINELRGPFAEIGQNREYVELMRNKAEAKLPTYFRVYSDHIDAKKGGNWERVSNGHWVK